MLSVERYLTCKNPQLLIPQYSTAAVTIQREKVEQIRKEKGIPIRVLEKKINLSKSRYYRWLQYQVDLPLELLFSLKKLLNLTDWEMFQLFTNSTDEQIEILTLIIFFSDATTEEDFSFFIQLKEKLEKYRVSKIGNIPYKLVLYYSDLCEACYYRKETMNYIKQIETYFIETDYFTMFDIFLYVSMLTMKLKYNLPELVLEKETDILEKKLLRKLSKDHLAEWCSILIGCVLDLSFYYRNREGSDKAIRLMEQTLTLLESTNQLDPYNDELLKFTINLFNVKSVPEKDEEINSFKRRFVAASWSMPQSEINYVNKLLS